MHSRPLIVFVLCAVVAGRALSESHGGDVANEDKALLFDVFSKSDSECKGDSELYYETWGSIALSRGGNGTKSSCYAKEEVNGETVYETVWCGPDPATQIDYWGIQRHTTSDCPGEGQNVMIMAKGTCYPDPATGIYVQFKGCADVPPEGAKQGQYEAVSGAAGSRANCLALIVGLAWAMVAAFAA